MNNIEIIFDHTGRVIPENYYRSEVTKHIFKPHGKYTGINPQDLIFIDIISTHNPGTFRIEKELYDKLRYHQALAKITNDEDIFIAWLPHEEDHIMYFNIYALFIETSVDDSA